MLTLTDLDLVTRPCRRFRHYYRLRGMPGPPGWTFLANDYDDIHSLGLLIFTPRALRS